MSVQNSRRCFRLGPYTPAWTTSAILVAGLIYLVNAWVPESIRWGLSPGELVDLFVRHHWWTLITNAFFHIDHWHLTSNLIFAWIFCRVFEEHVGTLRAMGFWCFAGIITKWSEILYGSHGVGLSCVVLAVFGYQLAAFRSVSAFAPFFDSRRWMLWLLSMFSAIELVGDLFVVSLELTRPPDRMAMARLPVSCVGHLSGFLVGFVSGYLIERRRNVVAFQLIAATSCLAALTTLTHAPGLSSWKFAQGQKAFESEQFAEARQWFDQSSQTPGAFCFAAWSSLNLTDDVATSERLESCLTSLDDENERRRVMNLLAWKYAVSSQTETRHPEKAVVYAATVSEATNWKKAPYLDTLAAAYASRGDFDAAIHWQERAIKLIADKPESELFREFSARLELYRRREAFREHPRAQTFDKGEVVDTPDTRSR